MPVWIREPYSKVGDAFARVPDQHRSGYTCFAAIAYCVPQDIKEVGYKVFLGRRKYFVSVDVGGGRIQWYAFLNIPPGGVPEGMRKGEGAIDFLRPQCEAEQL